MDTKLLHEDLFADANLVIEEGANGKDMYLVGTMMQGGIKNRNNRTYTVEDISKAVDMINEKLKNGESVMGELDHPQSLTINLDRVSHVITEARMEGNNAVGKMKILDTPMGQIAKTLIKGGVQLGVSSRGTGAVANDGAVKNFMFSTVDIVAVPSAPGAYPQGVMEALEIATNIGGNNPVIELSEAVAHDVNAQKYFEKELLKFIKSLGK